MAAADGTLLGYTNNRLPERVRRFLRESMAKFQPAVTRKLTVETEDAKYILRPPKGGLIIRVQAKVLGGYPETGDRFQQIFQSAISRDNLWTTADEHRQLAAGRFPESLATRIAKYSLVDNTRGEPPRWNRDEVVSCAFQISGKQVTGHCELKSADGRRSYSADLLGELTVSEGTITRFNMVAKGMFSGEGRYTPGAPKGRFPLAISFTLADGTDIADDVPPQGARGWLSGYLR